MIFSKPTRLTSLLLFLLLAVCGAWAQQAPVRVPSSHSDTVSTEEFSKDVTAFLGKEISAQVADIRSFDPPQEKVVGVPTTGDFDWGTFTRAVASYAALSGDKTIAGREVTTIIGQGGLIEARHGGKTFSQFAGAPSLWRVFSGL